jgi:hypothetical protein
MVARIGRASEVSLNEFHKIRSETRSAVVNSGKAVSARLTKAYADRRNWQQMLFRRPLGQNPLQGAAMHIEAPRGFRNVTPA